MNIFILNFNIEYIENPKDFPYKKNVWTGLKSE